MANRQISSLPAATTVDDDSLFVIEQQNEAMKATGAQWKGYAVAAVQPLSDSATASATAAAKSATQVEVIAAIRGKLRKLNEVMEKGADKDG